MLMLNPPEWCTTCSLMRHHGCSGLGFKGLANTDVTNTARKDCKTVANACECATCAALLFRCCAATLPEWCTPCSLVRHSGCSGLDFSGLTSTHVTNTARKYCKMVANACECATCFALLFHFVVPHHYRSGAHRVVSCVTVGAQVWTSAV